MSADSAGPKNHNADVFRPGSLLFIFITKYLIIHLRKRSRLRLKIQFHLRLCRLNVIARDHINIKGFATCVIRRWGYIVGKIVQRHCAEIDNAIITDFNLTGAGHNLRREIHILASIGKRRNEGSAGPKKRTNL